MENLDRRKEPYAQVRGFQITQRLLLHFTFGPLTSDGLCGSYASKPDRTITSGLPTTHQLVNYVLTPTSYLCPSDWVLPGRVLT